MAGRLAGQVALITGAGTGIGAAIARAFAAEGARVTLACLHPHEGQQVAQTLPRAEDALVVACDVTREDDVHAALAATIERFGALTVLCNNAGVEGVSKPISEYPTDAFDAVVAVNLRGVFLGMKHAIPLMRSGGAIINITSIAGFKGFAGAGPYGASKAGIIQLTRVAALECARQGIRVNAIAPGFVETPMLRRSVADPTAWKGFMGMQPLGRFGTPEEIAQAAVFLASREASFVSGEVLVADGAMTAG